MLRFNPNPPGVKHVGTFLTHRNLKSQKSHIWKLIFREEKIKTDYQVSKINCYLVQTKIFQYFLKQILKICNNLTPLGLGLIN